MSHFWRSLEGREGAREGRKNARRGGDHKVDEEPTGLPISFLPSHVVIRYKHVHNGGYLLPANSERATTAGSSREKREEGAGEL